LIGLEISQRLRKHVDILEYHNNNEFAPFIKVDPYLVFGHEEERQGNLTHLTLLLQTNETIIEYFKNSPPTSSEITNCIKKNFENNFVYFPNDYSHRQKGTPGHTHLILKYDNKSLEYEILENINDVLIKTKKTDEAIDYFIRNELAFKIGAIQIINE
jgi:hypothetical protein